MPAHTKVTVDPETIKHLMPFRQFHEEYRSRIKKEMTEIKKKLGTRS